MFDTQRQSYNKRKEEQILHINFTNPKKEPVSVASDVSNLSSDAFPKTREKTCHWIGQLFRTKYPKKNEKILKPDVAPGFQFRFQLKRNTSSPEASGLNPG